MVEISIPSVYSDKNNQILRLRASDVAAIAGYNPHANKLELFHEYLYQDLGDLLILDAQNVGMVVIEKKEEIDNIINLLPSADAADLKILRKKSLDRSVKSDSNESCKLIEKVKKLLDAERVKTAVPKMSLNFLQEELVGDVRKSYGKTCEQSAIQRYEEHTGHSVDSRNNMVLVWPLLSTHFSSSEDCKEKKKGGVERALPIYISSHFPVGSGGFAISKDKCYHSTRSASSSASSLKCTAGSASATSLIDLTVSGIGAADAEDGILQRLDGREHRRINDLQHPAKKETPIFKIVGKVDGISRHIDASSNDPTHWHEYRVVVEIKNRMNKIPAIPPLYDQIQLVTYMLMLGTACGDLVQVVTRGNQCKVKGCYEDRAPSLPPPLTQSSSSASESSHNHSNRPSPSPTAPSHNQPDHPSSSPSPTAPSHHISDPPPPFPSTSSHHISDPPSPSTSTSTSTSTSAPSHDKSDRPSTSPSAPLHDKSDHPSPPPSTRASIPSLSSISPSVAPTLKKSKLDMVLDFSVCRVLLNAPPYNHKDYFFSTVMPRLKVFSDAVASFRADDSQRYQWLLGSLEEKRDLLYSLCPYMKDAAVC